MTELKLIALDPEDLAVVSAHLQDAVVMVGDMAFLPRDRRFAALLNRFDWSATLAGGHRGRTNMRRRAALRLERVKSAKHMGIDLAAKAVALSLLAIRFEETVPPAGEVVLVFAGGGAIRLEVDCIEAELRDLGAAWRARAKPDHGPGDGGGTGTTGQG